MTKKQKKAEMMELGHDLSMFAEQIKEAAQSQGDPASPWTIEDWLNRYRDLFKN